MTGVGLPHKIAVIDDKKDMRDLKMRQLRRMFFQAHEIVGRFSKPYDLVKAIIDQGFDGALIDNRLAFGQFASFDGAEPAALLNKSGVPAVLVSQFVSDDADNSIRRVREFLPVVLTKAEANRSLALQEAFRTCAEELHGIIPEHRKPARALIRVVSVEEKPSNPRNSMVNVTIMAWRPDNIVRFPLDIVPRDLYSMMKPGCYLIASVNIGATRAEDLFFLDFSMSKGPMEESAIVYSNDY